VGARGQFIGGGHNFLRKRDSSMPQPEKKISCRPLPREKVGKGIARGMLVRRSGFLRTLQKKSQGWLLIGEKRDPLIFLRDYSDLYESYFLNLKGPRAGQDAHKIPYLEKHRLLLPEEGPLSPSLPGRGIAD